jgi:hypothetical protein
VEEAVGAVEPLMEAADLAADEPLGLRITVIALQPHDPAVLDRDLEAAGVWTVQGAGAPVDGAVRVPVPRIAERVRQKPAAFMTNLYSRCL